MINEMINEMQSSEVRVAYLVSTELLNMREVECDLVMMNTR